MESNNLKNPEIERLRAVAVIMTTVAHGMFSSFLPLFMVNSFTGVDIFFVISGFVVTLSLLKTFPKLNKNQSLSTKIAKSAVFLKTFYLKRAFRILPLAIFWLFTYLLLSIVFKKIGGGGNFGPPDQITREVVAVLSGFYNYLISYGMSGNIGHFWSLCVEEQFYAILPLFMVINITKKDRLKKLSLILLFLLIILPLSRDIFRIPLLKYIYAQRYFTLIFGVILALFYQGKSIVTEKSSFLYYRLSNFFNHSKFKKIIPKKYLDRSISAITLIPINIFVLVLIFVIWVIPGIPVDGTEVLMHSIGFFVVGLAATLLVFLASKESGWVLNIPFLKNILEYLGSRSYGIYLSHFAFIRLKPTILTLFYYQLPRWVELSPSGVFLQNALAWLGILLVSEISFRLLEKPMIAFGKAYIKYTVS